VSDSKENIEVKKSPSNTSFKILLNNETSNFELFVNNIYFYSGNAKKEAKKNLLVPKKFQSNF
tara:strand:- start:1431 stop:1619 length:189 start_codon:yes stop_codon:yes gene_type:complete